MKKNVKVMGIGAHSDECHYGCGGTFALLTQLGCECRFVHVSCHNHTMTPEQLEQFDRNMDAGAEVLGCRHIVIGDRGHELYEGGTRDRALIMEQLEEFQPDLLFIMWPKDSHPEHRLTALCSYEAYLNSLWNGKLNCVREIYAYEVGPNQNGAYFHPEFCINITEVWPKVKLALETCLPHKKYTSQEKNIASRYRAHCAGFTPEDHVECFKIVKFPCEMGLEGSDLLLRRLLADQFHWGGHNPWPYGNEAYFR